jgi:DHA1 family bicyclomycin/chloramphenicol resistance-like MFS transporter
MVAPRAIVRDVFPVEENAKIFSLLILVLGISPILAPTAGSYIIPHYGWHYVFVVLALVSTLLLGAVIFLLRESKAPDPQFSLKPKGIAKSFWMVLKEPQFATYSLTGAVSSAGLFAYLSGSPFVFMELYGLTEQQYGWIFALIAAGLITSSQLNTLLLRTYSSERIIKSTLIIQTGISIILVIGTQMQWFGLAGIIACIFIYLSCQGFSFPNSAALSMAPFTKEAGSASAVMGALQMGIGALASAMVGFFNNGTTLPLTAMLCGCAIAGLLILEMGRRKIHTHRKRKLEAITLQPPAPEAAVQT